MPAVEALLPRFRSAHTQVLGVSVDSVFSHANWAAKDLGGISFPLLADFHPKGAMAASYGLYLQEKGITDRATVFIDASGVVRHASSVTPAGERNIEELAAMCEELDREHGSDLPDIAAPTGLESGAELFVKSSCGFSRAVLLARTNLHLDPKLPVKNVSESGDAMSQLESLTGKKQAPCLVVGGDPLLESADIIKRLVSVATDLPG